MERLEISRRDMDAWLNHHVTAKEISEKYKCSRGKALTMLIEAATNSYSKTRFEGRR